MTDLEKQLESMPLDELIEGINAFTATTRERELTPEEAGRRQAYRAEYIRRFSRNLRATLDNTTFEFADEDQDGSNG